VLIGSVNDAFLSYDHFLNKIVQTYAFGATLMKLCQSKLSIETPFNKDIISVAS
jgi:hypothetical protein